MGRCHSSHASRPPSLALLLLFICRCCDSWPHPEMCHRLTASPPHSPQALLLLFTIAAIPALILACVTALSHLPLQVLLLLFAVAAIPALVLACVTAGLSVRDGAGLSAYHAADLAMAALHAGAGVAAAAWWAMGGCCC